jgi:hypothetical protein
MTPTASSSRGGRYFFTPIKSFSPLKIISSRLRDIFYRDDAKQVDAGAARREIFVDPPSAIFSTQYGSKELKDHGRTRTISGQLPGPWA